MDLTRVTSSDAVLQVRSHIAVVVNALRLSLCMDKSSIVLFEGLPALSLLFRYVCHHCCR